MKLEILPSHCFFTKIHKCNDFMILAQNDLRCHSNYLAKLLILTTFFT